RRADAGGRGRALRHALPRCAARRRSEPAHRHHAAPLSRMRPGRPLVKVRMSPRANSDPFWQSQGGGDVTGLKPDPAARNTPLTREQRNAFAAAFIGWAMDAYDYFIVVLVYAE